MKACGISLYRVAAPLMGFAVVASGLMFVLQEQVLAYANRRAEAIRHEIRGGSPRTFDVVNRKWLVARDGDIYNYMFYDPRRQRAERPLRLPVQSRDAGAPRDAHLRRQAIVSMRRTGPERLASVETGGTASSRRGRHEAASSTFPGRDLRLEAPRVLRDRVARTPTA